MMLSLIWELLFSLLETPSWEEKAKEDWGEKKLTKVSDQEGRSELGTSGLLPTWEDLKFKTRLGYIVRSFLRNQSVCDG